MVSITLAVPEELHRIMEFHNEIKWSEIARRAIWEHAKKLELMDKLTTKSKLTEKQAEEIGEKIKSNLNKRHVK